MKRRLFSTIVLSLAFAAPVLAQSFPEKPVRLVVPYGAGGNFDIIARLIGQHLGELWGRPVVIDNKPGANGNIGTAEVLRMAPDGYNLVLVSNGTLAINPGLYKSMPFDSVNGMSFITIVTSNPMVLVVPVNSPFKTAQDLVAYARANPGKLNLANGGNGTLSHLSAEMLKARTGSQIVTVPYKGTSFAVTGLLGGEVQGMFDTISTSIPLMDGGKLRGLAVTSPKRFPLRPELPTMSEVGVKDYFAQAKAGLVGPPGMPRDLVNRIQADVATVLKKPEVRQRLLSLGVEPEGLTPDEFVADNRAEIARWTDIVKASGAKAE